MCAVFCILQNFLLLTHTIFNDSRRYIGNQNDRKKNITFSEKRKMMTAIKKNRCRGILETLRNQMVNKRND